MAFSVLDRQFGPSGLQGGVLCLSLVLCDVHWCLFDLVPGSDWVFWAVAVCVDVCLVVCPGGAPDVRDVHQAGVELFDECFVVFGVVIEFDFVEILAFGDRLARVDEYGVLAWCAFVARRVFVILVK